MTSSEIKAHARTLGFDACGIAPAADHAELRFYREWLDRGYAGEMAYLHRTAERRADVRHVVPSARTVIVTATVYNTDRPYSTECADPGRAQIARYAWGDDYHDVIAARLGSLLAWMREQSPEPFDARAYVDTGPVQERVYAQHAGVGWIGKNTCVINPELGSWVFLGGDHLQPAAGRRRAVARSVRHVHAVPRGVPDTGAGRAGRPRFDPLHFVSDDRAPRRHSRGAPRPASAPTSTGAISVRKSVRGTRPRRGRTIARGSRVPPGTASIS